MSRQAIVPAVEPATPLSLIEVPEGVRPEHWSMLMAAAPWLTVSDAIVAVAFVHAWGEYEEARGGVEADGGIILQGPRGKRAPSPWYTIAVQRRGEIVRLARELGLSPLVRAQTRK